MLVFYKCEHYRAVRFVLLGELGHSTIARIQGSKTLCNMTPFSTGLAHLGGPSTRNILLFLQAQSRLIAKGISKILLKFLEDPLG